MKSGLAGNTVTHPLEENYFNGFTILEAPLPNMNQLKVNMKI